MSIHIKKLLLILLLIPIIVAWPINSALGYTSTLKDNYYAGTGMYTTIYGAYWRAQTFTAQTSYTITSVKLYTCREGATSYTFTVSIKNTSGGKPYGSDLTVGTIAGSSISTSAAWHQITFSTPIEITEGVKYAIVARYGSGSSSYKILWEYGTAYGNGAFYSSVNSGSTWDEVTGYDLSFQCWGYVLEPPSGVIGFSIKKNSDNTVTANWTLSESAEGARLVREYIKYPETKDSPTNIYEGAETSYTDYGIAPYLSVYYRIWEYNAVGWSGYEQDFIGGESMNVTIEYLPPIDITMDVPFAAYAFIFGMLLLFIAFFIKSPFLSFAVFWAMLVVMIEPKFSNTWFQYAGACVLGWSVIATVKRFMDWRND